MTEYNNNELLAKARALVANLERGDGVGAEAIISDLAAEQESELFLEVGRLTRELHEAINGFLLDKRIMELANREIPDASERLRHVIEMTEQAAHTTLSAVEVSLPFVNQLERGAGDLADGWEHFRARRLSVEDFRDLSDRIERFLSFTKHGADDLHKNLSEVLIAQDFQDLTGQIIRKVIALVQDVEEKLVMLVQISGNKHQLPIAGAEDEDGLAGPAVPGVDRGGIMQGQDDVDDLLSSLGF